MIDEIPIVRPKKYQKAYEDYIFKKVKMIEDRYYKEKKMNEWKLLF